MSFTFEQNIQKANKSICVHFILSSIEPVLVCECVSAKCRTCKKEVGSVQRECDRAEIYIEIPRKIGMCQEGVRLIYLDADEFNRRNQGHRIAVPVRNLVKAIVVDVFAFKVVLFQAAFIFFLFFDAKFE